MKVVKDARIYFPGRHAYLSFEEWKKLCEKLGIERWKL